MAKVHPFDGSDFELAKKYDGNSGSALQAGGTHDGSVIWFGIHLSDVPNQAPTLNFMELFSIFWWFGCRAFGGPIAQIAMMRDEIVIQKKWISVDRFSQVGDIYQKLPGPEATELACYLGNLSRGRIGAVLGGLGFILPGVSLVLISSYLYHSFGVKNIRAQVSFKCMEVAMSAFMFCSNYALSQRALTDKSLNFSWFKAYLSLFCFLASTIGINIFITLSLCGLMNAIIMSKLPYRNLVNIFISGATFGFYILYVRLSGLPEDPVFGRSMSKSGDSLSGLFQLGLIAGLVSFGGAYSTLPFVYTDAVVSGGWLSTEQFLAALALTNVLPTPLVSFVGFIGYIGGNFPGAVLMLIGIFLPAFSFYMIGSKYFEAVVESDFFVPFIDGLFAAIIGFLAVTSFQVIKDIILNGVDAVIFVLSFYSILHFQHYKYVHMVVIIIAAVVGQVLN